MMAGYKTFLLKMTLNKPTNQQARMDYE